jgi:3-oxoacyl-[acyl-carrier protein] reductase
MPENTRELDGAVAIVTGSARNIGRAIALQLAVAGAAVVVNARTSREAAEATAGEITERGGRALVHLADVTSPEQVDSLVAAAVERFGRLDLLINNAALRRNAPVTEISYEDWREVTASILDAAFLCVRACRISPRAAAARSSTSAAWPAMRASAVARTLSPPRPASPA